MNNEIKTDLKLTIPIKSVPNEIKENKDKLVHYLSKVLTDYVTKYKSSGYRIFGIEYGKVLNDNSLNTSDFKRILYKAKKSDSYDVEINKGKNIYEYLIIENKEQIIHSESNLNKTLLEQTSSYHSFTRNSSQIIYYGVPGSGKSYSSEQLEFKKSALRPDTIMITSRGSENQKIFVLDSKYYRYGVTRNPCDLPSSGSIIKQMAYAEYIETQESKSELYPASKAIYNAFILPFDSNALDAKMKCVGFVETDYKSGDKPYNKIKAILLDTKSIMQNYSHSEKLISGLAELIESKS